jgi:hypothetical protein
MGSRNLSRSIRPGAGLSVVVNRQQSLTAALQLATAVKWSCILRRRSIENLHDLRRSDSPGTRESWSQEPRIDGSSYSAIQTLAEQS